MSAPTFKQARRVVDFFDEVKATNEELQNWLGAGDLQKMMLKADLTRVDRQAFHALLNPPPVPIKWGSAIDYVTKIRDWNQRFYLGLSDQQIDELFSVLPAHASPLQPTGISLTLGRGLRYDWEVVMKILEYEIEKLNVRFNPYVDALHVSYFPGSMPATNEGPTLDSSVAGHRHVLGSPERHRAS